MSKDHSAAEEEEEEKLFEDAVSSAEKDTEENDDEKRKTTARQNIKKQDKEKDKERKEEGDECPICLEVLPKDVSQFVRWTCCGNGMHKHCDTDLASMNMDGTCPLCRAKTLQKHQLQMRRSFSSMGEEKESLGAVPYGTNVQKWCRRETIVRDGKDTVRTSGTAG